MMLNTSCGQACFALLWILDHMCRRSTASLQCGPEACKWFFKFVKDSFTIVKNSRNLPFCGSPVGFCWQICVRRSRRTRVWFPRDGFASCGSEGSTGLGSRDHTGRKWKDAHLCESWRKYVIEWWDIEILEALLLPLMADKVGLSSKGRIALVALEWFGVKLGEKVR